MISPELEHYKENEGKNVTLMKLTKNISVYEIPTAEKNFIEELLSGKRKTVFILILAFQNSQDNNTANNKAAFVCMM